ncbi:hypothetical protein ACHAXM_009086 [Skeletonema potamos]
MMMATTNATTNELAADDNDGLPARRSRAGGQRRGTNNLSISFKAFSIDNNEFEVSSSNDSTPPKRRTPSRRERGGSLGSCLSSSLQDRALGGIDRTEGRLSVSFADPRGLPSAMIADILSGAGLDPPDIPSSEPQKSLKELMDEQEEAVEGRDSVGSLGDSPKTLSPRSQKRRSRHLQLATIISQKSMNFIEE